MGKNFSGGLLAGVVAAVIWTSIAMWLGVSTQTVGLLALVFLIATAAVSTAISTIVDKSKTAAVSTP